MTLLVLFTISLIINHINCLLTDDEKNTAAIKLLANHFHNKIEHRSWNKNIYTGLYLRYICNEQYCTGMNIDGKEECWKISLHIHPTQWKQFDRIYATEWGAPLPLQQPQRPYLKVQKLNSGAFMNIAEYDIVTNELSDQSGTISTPPNREPILESIIQEGRPQCKQFCNGVILVNSNTNTQAVSGDWEVIIQNEYSMNKGSIRVDPEEYPTNAENLKTTGAQGDYARFDLNLVHDGDNSIVKLKSKKTEKYVKILEENGGYVVRAHGDYGGNKSKFKVHQDGDWYKLESVVYPGQYIQISDNKVNVVAGNGNAHSKFKFYKLSG